MKSETLSMRLSEEEKKLIAELAWQNRMSIAQFIVSLARKAESFQQPGSSPDCSICCHCAGEGICAHSGVSKEEKVRFYHVCAMFQ